MNIKSLLLGSAAALAAVSGARAADAVVVAEPEPMEYVRICDVYGAGFYYIPGTETCLKVGGYLRYDVRAGKGGYGGLIGVDDKRDLAEFIRGDRDENDIRTHDTYYKRARAALKLDARSETELGTLRGYMHVDFDWNTVDRGGFTDAAQNWGIEHAYIELGGFRIGKTDSLFSTLVGYAGNVLEDDLIQAGPYDTHQIAYTFTGGNGFSAAVAVEEGSDGYTLDSYVPHVVAGAAYTQGWGGVSGVVGYDSVFNEWAGKVRLDVNATEQLSLFAMVGYGSEKNVPYSWYKTWSGKTAVWGGASYQFNDKLSANLQASYAQGGGKFETPREVAVVANVAYTIVPGFTITPEVAWQQARWTNASDERVRENAWGGMIRFQRSF